MTGTTTRNPAARFATLDAIRGICAIIVMATHSRMLTGYDPFPEGYLVVDLFFLMSGFVLGHAYDARLERGGYLGTFLLRRYARLLPMWAIGIAIGSLWPLYHYLKTGNVAAWVGIALTQLAFLPAFWTVARPLTFLFPFNTPGWSLFSELVANLGYGLFARVLTRRVLIGLVALGFAALAWAAFSHGGLWGGSQWYLAPNDLARVGFSFFLGLLLYKLPRPGDGGRPARVLFVAGLVLMTLLVWFAPNRDPTLRALRDLATVALFMPALMWVALRVELRRPAFAEILGMISYPLYAVHLTVLVAFRAVFSYLHHWDGSLVPMSYNVALLGCTLLLAYLLGRFVDPSAQRWAARLIHQRPVHVPALPAAGERQAG